MDSGALADPRRPRRSDGAVHRISLRSTGTAIVDDLLLGDLIA